MSSRGSRMFSSGSHVLYLGEGRRAAVTAGPCRRGRGPGQSRPAAPGPAGAGCGAGVPGRGMGGGGRGDGTVYLAQLLFRRNSRHVMMKFSKSPFPDPGKRPRGGGGTRPPRPGPPRAPPPALSCKPRTLRSGRARSGAGAAPASAAALGAAGRRGRFLRLFPLSPPFLPPPPRSVLQYGARLPRRERGKEPFSGAHQPPPARLPPPSPPGPAAASRRPLAAPAGALPGAPSPAPSPPGAGTHLGDHPLHFTRYSTLP